MPRIASRFWSPILLLSGLVVAGAQPSRSDALPNVVSAREAHAKAEAGEVVLIDIRAPDEWKETGVPASAYAITMHQDHNTFMLQLDAATGGVRDRPVALICAVGGRSAALRGRLHRAGHANVIDVGEGVLGNRRGPGWIKSGLPLRRWAIGLSAPKKVSN